VAALLSSAKASEPSASNKRPRFDKPRQATTTFTASRNNSQPAQKTTTTDDPPVNPQKPDFGLSGALTKETGRMYKGVLLKFQEPPDARVPTLHWRLYVYKDDKEADVLHVSRQSAYLIGRNADIADIPLAHASISSQHAVLQYRGIERNGKIQCVPYIMDLESANGTFINGVKIDGARYYQLKSGDVIKFGASTREYVLINAKKT
jgi:smad nuclear-interacting protein 1